MHKSYDLKIAWLKAELSGEACMDISMKKTQTTAKHLN